MTKRNSLYVRILVVVAVAGIMTAIYFSLGESWQLIRIGDRIVNAQLDDPDSEQERTNLQHRVWITVLELECERRGIRPTREEIVQYTRNILTEIRNDETMREEFEARSRPGFTEVADWTDEELDGYRWTIYSALITEDELKRNPVSQNEIDAYRERMLRFNEDYEAEEDLLRWNVVRERMELVEADMQYRYEAKVVAPPRVPEDLVSYINKNIVEFAQVYGDRDWLWDERDKDASN